MPVYSFSVRTVLGNAWTVFRAHTTEYVLYALALLIFSNLLGLILPMHPSLLWLVQLLVSPALGIMCARVALASLHNTVPEWEELLEFSQYREALVATILQIIITSVGFVLLIIPGIIAAVGLAFTTLLIVDKKLTAVEALKESWRITKGNRLQIFILLIVLILINMLGAILLFIGLLVSVPVSLLAIAGAYNALKSHAGEHITKAHS